MSAPGQPVNGEPPRDEHLRAALRHAPDAGLDAPADVGAQIRAAAWRAATAAPAASVPRSAAPSWPHRLWPWLGTPSRMGASGAFATMLIAGVIGLLWRGEAPPPPQVEAKRPFESAPPAAPRAMPAPAALPAAPEAVARTNAPAAAVARAPAPATATAAAPTPTAAPAADRREARAATQASVADQPPAAPWPSAAPAPAPAPVSPQPAEPLAARSRNDTAQGTATAEAADSAERARPAVAASPAMASRSLHAAEGAKRALAKAAGTSAASDFAGWLDEAAARADATPLLHELLAATRGRWLPAAPPLQAGPDRPWSELPSAGRAAATLTVGEDAAWGCLPTPAPPRCQRAPLSPEQSTRLRESMAAPRR